MAQTFALPQGFSTTAPNAAPAPAAGTFALPDGFSLAPPAKSGAAPQMPNAIDQAIGNVPLFGQVYNAGKMAVDALNQGGSPGPGERRGTLAPVIRDQQTGALRLAWPQLAVDAASALGLPGDVASGKTPLDPRLPYSMQDPATLDRAGNLASMASAGAPMTETGMAPAASSMGRTLIGADGKTVPRLVTGDLTKSGIAPQDVNAAIQQMGPGAVLADISPVLQGRAAKLATLPEQAQTIVADTLGARQAAAGPRIKAAIGDIAGPEPVPSTIAAGIDARKEVLGPYYDKLIDGAKMPVSTQSIVANLNGNVAMMRGPAQQALAKVRQMFDLPQTLRTPGGPTITRDPRTVFEIRNAIDGMLTTETNPKVIGALTMTRQKIDNSLAAAVPGLKRLDALYQEQARQQEGFNMGRASLSHGENPIHPDDLGAAMQQTAMQSTAGPMPHPSQFPGMIQQGQLSKMYEIVGNNVNDRISLKKIITGEGKWNYQKIAAAFGKDKAQQLLDLFKNEATMANTENLALGGSKTARMASGGQGMEANPNAGSFLKNAMNLDFGDAAMGLASKVTGGAFDAKRAARNAAIADALMSSGGFRAGPAATPGLFGRGILPPQLLIPGTTGEVKRNVADLRRMLGMS